MASKAEQQIQKRMYDKVNRDSFRNEIGKIADRDMKTKRK